LLLAVVCTVLTGRYLWEREYIGSAWAGFNDARRISHDAVAAPNGRAAVVQAAAELRYMAVLLDDAYGTGASPMLNPYTEHRLVKDSVSRTYHRHLQKVFWPEVQRYVAQTLADDTAMQSADLYETLKVYLMLATPERRNADALVAWFDRRWERLAPPGSTASDQGAFDYHLRALFEPAGDAVPAMKVDTDLLRGARVRAADLPLPQRVVSRIQALPMPAGIDGVSLASAGGGQVSLALRRGGEATANDIAVSGLFTRDGYSQLFLAQLDRTAANVLEEGAWVLDEGVDAGRRGGAYTTTQRLTDDAHRLYLQQYADVWDGFLKDIRIRPVASLDDASQLANQLAAPSSPLGNVVGFAAAQTTLAGNADGSLARATRSIEKGKVALIDQLAGERSSTGSLAGQIVDAHFESLHRLARRGDDRQADDPLARMFAELADQLGTLVGALRAGQIMPRSDVLTRLRGDANRQPEPVRGIVNELIRIAGTQSLQSSRSQLAQGASGLGSGVCARTVTGRYPFDRGASDEIGMDDFIKVFGRRGALQTFFDANLASHVDANAYPWRARADADGGATVVGAGTLRSFENATRIRDAFFTASDAIGFSMILRPIELDASILEATLDIDGQVLKYAHGPQQPMRIDWPGPRGGVYARLTLRLANGQTEALNFDGPWALFRLFDAAGKRVLGADRRELTVQTGSGRFRFEIRSSMQDFPLWSQALARFRCPS
jgi:type VI secretion system protein ImpL